jgi:TIGR03009 family protein
MAEPPGEISMRSLGLTLASLFTLVPALAAQPSSYNPAIPVPGTNPPGTNPPRNNPPAPVLDPNNRLDALLMQWEARMKNVDSIWVSEMTRTDKDKDGTEKVLKGEARFLKPNYAAVQLVRVDNPKLYEMYISTGNLGYDFRPQTKTLRIYQLPPQKVGMMNAGILSFVGGMGAAQSKARFDLTLTKDMGPDSPFIYIKVVPKNDDDKREFVEAQLVLVSDTMLPRRLWLAQANGNQVTYDLVKTDTKTQLKPADFTAPSAPQGWKVEEVPLEKTTFPVTPAAQPRVYRPAAPGK